MRDCKHGRLARSCPECDLMADLVEACHGWANGIALLTEIVECGALACPGAPYCNCLLCEARAYLAGKEADRGR